MQSLKELIEQYGEPDILIDSFNSKAKRYAIWGFAEVLQIKKNGIYLNNQLIKGDFEQNFQKIINQWKKDQNNKQIACVGFISYEFKNYIYNHINFDKQLNNKFPYLWFCKPTMIKEYKIEKSDKICAIEKLKILKDIMPLKNYKSKIDSIKNYLKNGDVYQINFTDKKILNSNINDSFKLYNNLRLIAKPEEGYFIKTNDFDILSLSPESFIKIKNGVIETAPIKGTRPSSKNKKENAKLKSELQNSPKDKAEHLMIVDLMRNDLGKICELGSIKIKKIYEIKTFETIHHMVTKIKGKLKQDVAEFDVLKALFPGGSITGAPKESAMRIIDKLEIEPRKIYTGSIGYITPTSNMMFNICIRTLLRDHNNYEYGIGGGIVWDSIAKDEWFEAQQKSKILEPLL